MPKGHALLSASGAARWLACTPSARLEEGFPNTSSEYAKEGTLAHALAENATRYMLGEMSEMDWKNTRDDLARSEDGQKFYCGEMQEHVFSYASFIKKKLDAIRKTCDDAFAELEVRVNFSKWVPQGFGTCDCAIIADGELEIIDLKYGKGHRVEAAGNPQMRLYALGAIEYYKTLYDIDRVRMTIFQPRLIGGISSDEITVKELTAWANKVVKPAAKLAYKGEGEFRPSEETCKFCRAKEQCRARFDENLKLFDESPDPRLITPEEAGEILAKAKDIKTWLEDLSSLIEKTLLGGTAVQGWKLVEGKSNRKFADEDKVVKAMVKAGYSKAVLYEKKLITLTQMEKDFGAKNLSEILGDLIVKPKGKPTVAPESDKRPEYQFEEEILKAFDE